MKLTIDRISLLRPLGQVQSVVERRNTIPILANVVLQAADGAFDLRRDIHVHVSSCHQQRAVSSLQHDIGQDRNGVAAFDHGLDLTERPKEADPIDGEFHRLSLLC